MAQAFLCTTCQVAYTAALRGRSCPSCGDELIHGRIPSGPTKYFVSRYKKRPHASRAVWDHIVKRDPCVYCGDTSTTIDHIQPKALGGSKGSWTNRTGSCFSCNQAKAHTPPLFFLLQMAGEDLSHILDDSGRWILDLDAELEEIVEARRRYEESQAKDGHVDPRKLILPMT